MSSHRQLKCGSALMGGAIAAFLLGAPAFAQVAQNPDDGSQVTSVDEIVVTGTRIRLPDYVAPNPVVSVDAAQLEASGQTNLTEYLSSLPALTNSLTLADGADTTTPDLAGMNLLNLRNLGTVRTLVLVDGRRHIASSPGTASVDVNTIPVALIERIEVLTGGASAVYGADGVSGVVNFILKKDFEGIDIRAQTGWSDAGGGESNFASILLGRNFNDRRGNVTFGYEYARDNALSFWERDFSTPGRRQILINNPDDPGTFGGPAANDPLIYNQILASNVRYIDTSRLGAVFTNFNTATSTSGVSFLGDGTPWTDGIYAGEFFMIGGDGSRLDDFNDDLLPGLERHAVSASFNYDLTPRVNVFADIKYTNNQTNFEAQPSYDYGLFLALDNPFMPDVIRNDALTPGGLGLDYGGVLMGRDNFDLGRQRYDIERETLRATLGFKGDLTDTMSYEVSYVYGRAEESQLASNVRINERFFAAIDVVDEGEFLTGVANGNFVCRSNLDPNAIPEGDWYAQFGFDPDTWGSTFTPGANSGCTPFNVFGEGLSPDAAAWINTTSDDTAVIDQHVFTAFISGDTSSFFNLPAGPMGFVLGGEYRRESSDYRPSAIRLLADALEYPITQAGRASVTEGSFDVREIFGEITVPILRDLPFARDLTVSAAYRYSDYSVSGGSETWNVNGQWRPVRDLMFRGGVAKAVRAPNVNDYFQGRSQTFAQLADPCSQPNLSLGENPQQRQQNCATALTALGVDPTSFINNSSESIGGFIRGNPDLQPETADTYTAGLVFTPSLVPGLSISLDYYDVEITDAIQSFTAQTIVNNCYDLAAGNEFCDLITRTSGGPNPGRISGFDQVPGNIASYETAGWDMNLRYAIDPSSWGLQNDIGRFHISLVANKLLKLRTVEASGAEPIDRLGRINAPEWQANLDIGWEYQNVAVTYGWNYFDQTLRFAPSTLRNTPDVSDPRYFRYNARSTHDLQVRYNINDSFEVYGGVNNMFDQQPEFNAYTYPVSPMGRFFYVGGRMRLGSVGDAMFWR